ncbi:MAG: hypothetical protein P4K83_02125 [Terracidiphilus sp.]|nr:hypothetical protein [Terracidiphilus sp.]
MGGYAGLMPAGALNVALSNFAKSYRNQKFIGDLFSPRVPVVKQTFQYIEWSEDDFRVPATTLRAPGARPTSIRNNYGTDTYFCHSHALEGEVPFESEAYGLGLGFSTRQKLTASLTKKLNLSREVEVASRALSLTSFPNGLAFSGTSMWDSYITTPANSTFETVTSHPIDDIETAKEALRQVGIADEEMVLALSSPVVRILVNHPEIVHRFQYTNVLGIIDIDKLSSVFGVKCVRAGAVQLSQNNAKTWVWGNSAFLGYAQPAPSMEDLSCMKTFSWTGEEGGGVDAGLVAAGADGFAVLEWIDQHLSTKKYWQSAEWYYDTKVTAQETGYPLLNVVSGDVMEVVPADIEG